jgi:hypothetical protein
VLGIAGLMVCFIGVFAAAGLIAFAQYHLMYQLYELYLERGGTPIPLKSEPAAPQPEDVPTVSAADPEGIKPPDQI